MKTATVRELRNRYTSLLRWVSAGEEIVITRHGQPVARLVPERNHQGAAVDWAGSLEVKRNRAGEPRISAKAKASLLAESGGSW